MKIIANRKIFYSVSIILVGVSLFALVTRGLNFGPDFTGDAVLDGIYTNSRPALDDIRIGFDEAKIELVALEERGDNGIFLRTRFLDEVNHQEVLRVLKSKGEFTEQSFVSHGPTVGKQLRRNAITAILVTLFAIICFIAYAFRQVSRPVSSWIYGLVAVIALGHDLAVPTGLFAWFGYQIDSLYISALLTVLGFSVHDTIVVFDRLRENLRKSTGGSFADIAERSLRETIVRSINTSMTTILALGAVYFFGGETTQPFALALIVGIAVGTYSSIFIATPLLVTIEGWKNKKRS
ncbi:MAG: protein translocase subunit SecF [Candidatus Ryanbacteria bacterium]|nr:protein translocase subunit SecF [Candidatus Ryanbacteria bacterium]